MTTHKREVVKMDIKKRNDYVNHLYGACHTLSGKAEFVDIKAAGHEEIVKTCYRKYDKGKNRHYMYLQLNPNKVIPNSMLKTFKEFEFVLDMALKRIRARGFSPTRIDMSFNSDHEDDYELFKKLNRLLICCIASAYNIKNCYQTSDLWTYESLSIAVKNDSIEAENYNKEKEAKGQVDTKNRLEFRSKRLRPESNMIDEFCVKWFERLDKAIQQFQTVQDRYNDELSKIWLKDRCKPDKERTYLSYTDFILKYRDCIFTRKQLEALLDKMGIENSTTKAKNFKKRHTIEFYSLTDLKIIVKAIKDTTLMYFYGTSALQKAS